ncbi:hypothetical protein IHC87_18115 [Photobacterium damselae subsp. damselae]|uniref:hypothetical protein n=1 Tax=Photobacterium damselae TaxID=38293 RepID=UPI001F1E5780|nr:hypothetical protein [Photobacterium damselae]UJZ96480.1 hypothetical protein IHC87_18115 [Photobacterium damselae subsp. damselae]UJZ99615.1 hypothetical protein IHC88_19370 [Photobacterium damselae subsp. damselae]
MKYSTSTKNYDTGDVVMAGIIIAIVSILTLYFVSFIYDLPVFDTLFLVLKIPFWVVLLITCIFIALITYIFSRKEDKEHNITGIGRGHYFGVNWEWNYLYYEDRYLPYMFKPICPICQKEMCKMISSERQGLQFRCIACDDMTSNVIPLSNTELDDFMGTIVSPPKKPEV